MIANQTTHLLRHLEFSRLVFCCEFQEAYTLSLEAFLRLRRNLMHAASLLGEGEGGVKLLFKPAPPSDPVARRRVQKPAPPFAVIPPPTLPLKLDAGDTLELRVVFVGAGIQLAPMWASVLQALGKAGFHRGEGVFELEAVKSIDASGAQGTIWLAGTPLEELTPVIQDAGWYLESCSLAPNGVILEFLTPARLLSRGRPLFRADFSSLFPFILRRVTSMAYAHGGLDLLRDPAPVVEGASGLECGRNTLEWSDWRSLEGDAGSHDLGGLTGRVEVAGAALSDIFWILQLAQLLNLGRGAPYGAGHFRLIPLP